EAMLLYLPLFIVVGIPIGWFFLKRVGYWNQIIHHARELAAGRLDQEVPVRGDAMLAGLARDINALKNGVQSSLREQAKSERLKTELITNVSHDLRTPLTSIITYTELLKNQEHSEEKRKHYIDVIA